jgi:adenylate cyclase
MTQNVQPSAWLEAPNGERLPLAGFNSLGRSSKNSMVLDSHTVSRRHALIQAQDVGEYWLVDLGSSNGTRLNDRRVTHPMRLQNSDVIEIGGRIYSFQQTDSIPADALTPSQTQGPTTARELRNASCWLLVTDIEGFSRLSKTLMPEALAQLVGCWLGSCTSIIQSRRGAINKYLGDGLFAYWTDGQETPAHVLAAMTELRQLQSQSNPAFRLALHHGEITIGGVSAVGEESLLGKEVNFVFRLEKLAAEMKLACLLSHAAVRSLPGAEKFIELPARPVPGFDGNFKLFTL